MRARNQRVAIIPLALLLTGLCPTFVTSSEATVLSNAAEKAKRATIGVLRPSAERATISGHEVRNMLFVEKFEKTVFMNISTC